MKAVKTIVTNALITYIHISSVITPRAQRAGFFTTLLNIFSSQIPVNSTYKKFTHLLACSFSAYTTPKHYSLLCGLKPIQIRRLFSLLNLLHRCLYCSHMLHFSIQTPSINSIAQFSMINKIVKS